MTSIIFCHFCQNVMNSRELVSDDGKRFLTYQCPECGERLPALDITTSRPVPLPNARTTGDDLSGGVVADLGRAVA